MQSSLQHVETRHSSSNRSAGSPSSAGTVKKRLLFVDDDVSVLKPFEQSPQAVGNQWDTVHVANALEALNLIAYSPFDAIVANLNLAGMDGVDLLNEVFKRHPGMLRILRCNPAERSWLERCQGAIPIQLPFDCSKELLESTLKRAFKLCLFMGDPDVQQLLSRFKRVPSLPVVYTQVMMGLSKPDESIEFIGRLISKDPAMTAKILQAINSTAFALPQRITHPSEAVLFLGAERTKCVILLASAVLQFDKENCAGFSFEKFWKHSLATGALAGLLMQTETNDPKQAELAFTAGLLHDLGKLLLAANAGELYEPVLSESKSREVPVHIVERELFGANHAELGACLLASWGLPLAIVEAVAWHHSPAQSGDDSFSAVTAVHVANALEYKKGNDIEGMSSSQIDEQYLTHLGLADRQPHWQSMCGCLARLEAHELESAPATPNW